MSGESTRLRGLERAKQQGREAFEQNQGREKCPYVKATYALAWMEGWRGALDEHLRRSTDVEARR